MDTLPGLQTIPHELRSLQHKENDVNIIVGENGSGKSQLLASLCKHFIENGKNVIAIANSVHDRFPSAKENLHLLRDRSGREKVKRVIKKALEQIEKGDTKKLRNIAQALDYVGYDPKIGIERIDVTPEMLQNAIGRKRDEEKRIERRSPETYLTYNSEVDNSRRELESILFKFSSLPPEPVIWITMTDYSFDEIHRSSILQLIKFESYLKSLDLINSVNIVLSKKGIDIKLYEASSGELSFISTIICLTVFINDNTVILIDEPENSLHPSWQKEYMKTIMDIFSLYQPKIVSATHSALIVTGSEISIPETNIYDSSNFRL